MMFFDFKTDNICQSLKSDWVLEPDCNNEVFVTFIWENNAIYRLCYPCFMVGADLMIASGNCDELTRIKLKQFKIKVMRKWETI